MYPTAVNKMARASLVLGIISIVATIFCTVYIPFIAGSLAILFALLSRGEERSFDEGRAKAGLATGIVGMLLNILLIILVIYSYMTIPFIHDYTNEVIRQSYGMSLDEMLSQISSGLPF